MKLYNFFQMCIQIVSSKKSEYIFCCFMFLPAALAPVYTGLLLKMDACMHLACLQLSCEEIRKKDQEKI